MNGFFRIMFMILLFSLFYQSAGNEMPMNYSLPLEPFDVWGFDFMGPFPAGAIAHCFGSGDNFDGL